MLYVVYFLQKCELRDNSSVATAWVFSDKRSGEEQGLHGQLALKYYQNVIWEESE